MQKILIADRSECFCNLIAENMKDRFCVKVCTDGVAVLDMVKTERPDLLVMELELPGMDGLSILRCLRDSGYAVPTIAMTSFVCSQYVLQRLNMLGVEYVMPKPCTVTAVVNSAVDILNAQNHIATSPEDELSALLMAMGLRSDLGGFAHLVEAIRIFGTDPQQQMTKTVYPEVAKICGGTPMSVERSIRSVIQKGWTNRNRALWSVYFDCTHAPSNSVFIARIAKKFNHRKVC